MPHIRFNWVDILFVTLLMRTGYVGFKSGFLSEFFRLFGLLAAFVVSFSNYTLASQFLSTRIHLTGIKMDVVSFLVIFLGILFIFKLFTLIMGIVSGGANISWLNRLIGLFLGIGRGILLISLIYFLFIAIPFKYLSKSAEDRAFSSQYIANIAPSIYKIAINFYPWKKIETPLVRRLEEV